MSFLDKIKDRINSIQETAESIESKLEHLFVDEKILEHRLSTCMSCEHLFHPTNQCKKCGCFVKVKTKLAMFECPLKKWTKVDI